MLVLTRAVGDVGLLVLSGISDRLELLLRQQPPLFQQAPLLPLLPLFQNHLEVKREKKTISMHPEKQTNTYTQFGQLTFFRAVGFFSLGTSLCLPFFTKGLVESKGLWAILSCCRRGFFWADSCFWTTGSPPPTTKKWTFSWVISQSQSDWKLIWLYSHNIMSEQTKEKKKAALGSIYCPPERMTGFTSCLSFWVCCFFSRAASMFPMSSWTGNLLFFPDTFSAFWKWQDRERRYNSSPCRDQP